ncbi:winged helix DNA-binding protein [Sphingomonas sp. HDW15A]|uniref:MarR family transcriptional regulator n=1 Tax=Sphingomonas sp. HDW15A TaxID=2714942 RepID=UPI00140BF0E2|nr:MarR family transcriptional regulator [Sphingomonas sp. HDW15A]QIK95816.1 winged helix DNA-binding protein [Sphingomonas sp. HDW15A]
MQATRDERSKFFEPHLFGEAGWDMLLAAYIAHGRGYRLKVSDACYESRVPVTTALRWLDHIERAGLVERRKNTVDRRSLLVSITPKGVTKMNDYLQAAAETLSRV